MNPASIQNFSRVISFGMGLRLHLYFEQGMLLKLKVER